MRHIFCVPKSLPRSAQAAATRRAVQVNPDNARRVVMRAAPRRGGPRRIVVVKQLKWPSSGVRLSVQFLDAPPADLRKRILQHMNAWSKTANVKFTETHGTGEVRISRSDDPKLAGYWSYLGTEILGIKEGRPTMNLEGFTMEETESEFRRVVRHEAGHTLGFDHEHMRTDVVDRIDEEKAYRYFRATNGWSRADVDAQVLTPLDQISIMGTAESDPHSIMCYQLPGSIMKDRKPVPGGLDINKIDAKFCASLYPKRRARSTRR
jgi:hypothetical protein